MPPSVPMPAPERDAERLTAYELARLENISRNRKALEAMHLPALGSAVVRPQSRGSGGGGACRKKREAPTEPPRRSTRLVNAPQTKLAALADDADEDGSGSSEREDAEDDDRRARKLRLVTTTFGFPEARSGAGVVFSPGGGGGGVQQVAERPPVPVSAPSLPRPAGPETLSSGYKVRQADGLQARVSATLRIAGDALLHPHEEAGLHDLLHLPPYYSPSKLADLLDRLREMARRPEFSAQAASPRILSGGVVAAELKVSKLAAIAAVRFLTRAKAINTHPDLVAARQCARTEEPLDEAALRAEAAIAEGVLTRRHVAPEEASPLPPGVFATTGRAVRFVSNALGFKGVHKSRDGGFIAELFDGPHRYNLGKYATAEEAAEAYDRACIRVRAVNQAMQLNFPLERYVASSQAASEAASARTDAPAALKADADAADALQAQALC